MSVQRFLWDGDVTDPDFIAVLDGGGIERVDSFFFSIPKLSKAKKRVELIKLFSDTVDLYKSYNIFFGFKTYEVDDVTGNKYPIGLNVGRKTGETFNAGLSLLRPLTDNTSSWLYTERPALRQFLNQHGIFNFFSSVKAINTVMDDHMKNGCGNPVLSKVNLDGTRVHTYKLFTKDDP